MISRRRFLLTGAAVLAAPLVAGAQQAPKVPRIAFISTTSPGASPATEAFLRGLRDLGYVEGQNIIVEWRWGRGTTERFPEFAADVVRLNVDVIVAANGPGGRAAQAATRTIRSHVMGNNALRSLRKGARALEGFWSSDFMDQDIHPLGVPDEIFGNTSVPGENDRTARMIDPVSECRLDRCVIHFKRGDFHAALLIHDTFANILSEDHDTSGGGGLSS